MDTRLHELVPERERGKVLLWATPESHTPGKRSETYPCLVLTGTRSIRKYFQGFTLEEKAFQCLRNWGAGILSIHGAVIRIGIFENLLWKWRLSWNL